MGWHAARDARRQAHATAGPEPWVVKRWSGGPRAMRMVSRDATEPLDGKALAGHVRRAGAGICTSRGTGAYQASEARENFWKNLLSTGRSDFTKTGATASRPAPTLFRGRGRKEPCLWAAGRLWLSRDIRLRRKERCSSLSCGEGRTASFLPESSSSAQLAG